MRPAVNGRSRRPRQGASVASSTHSGEWPVDRRAVEDVVGARIAPNLEPASASRTVIPEIVVWAAGIVAQIDVFDPGGLRRIRRRPPQRRIATVGKLDLVARPAPGAWNQHHDRRLSVPMDTDPRLFRRSFDLAQTVRA